MSDNITPNLFTSKTFAEFIANPPLVVTTKRVVEDHHITILGEKFELEDLYETLVSVKCDSIEITNREMVKVLKELGVIASNGSNRGGWGARAGENYDAFLTYIKGLYYAID